MGVTTCTASEPSEEAGAEVPASDHLAETLEAVAEEMDSTMETLAIVSSME